MPSQEIIYNVVQCIWDKRTNNGWTTKIKYYVQCKLSNAILTFLHLHTTKIYCNKNSSFYHFLNVHKFPWVFINSILTKISHRFLTYSNSYLIKYHCQDHILKWHQFQTVIIVSKIRILYRIFLFIFFLFFKVPN